MGVARRAAAPWPAATKAALVAGAAALMLGPGSGRAAPARRAGAVVEPGPDGGRIDWSRGLMLAVGAAAADIRAPSPAVARSAAERLARRRARAALAERAAALVLADGTRVGDPAADGKVAVRLSRAVSRALDIDIDYSSDGSVVITAGLPLEAIRLAVTGAPTAPRYAPPDPAAPPPTALVVDATGTLAQPALGLELHSGSAAYLGPTVFYAGAKAAKRDPRLGDRVVRAQARERRGASLEIDAPAGRLEAAARAGALVVIVVGDERDGN